MEHATLLKRTEPHAVVIEGVEASIERVVERTFISPFKAKAIRHVAVFFPVGGTGDFPSRALFFVIDVKDGVTQAASGSNDGHSTVAHGNHLCQTARLEHRRDQDDVAASVHEVRQRLVKREEETRVLAGELIGETVEISLNFGIRRATKQYKLPTSTDGVMCGVLDQVYTFLSGETRDDADDGLVVPTSHAEAIAKLSPGRCLALFSVLGVILDRHECIRFGVPNVGINAVTNTGKLAAVASDHRAARDFTRIGRRNRGRHL